MEELEKKEEEKVVKREEKVNVRSINELIRLSKRVLKIAYIFIIIIAVYGIIVISKEIGLIGFILKVLSIISPLFIGLAIAWLFNPLVRKLEKRGIKRGLGATIVYVCFVGILALVIFAVIPLLSEQITDFVGQIPHIADTAQKWISDIFANFDGIDGLDVQNIKLSLFAKIEDFGASLTESIPSITVNIISSVFSGIGVFLMAMIIGFYALVGLDNPTGAIKDFLPKKMHHNFEGIMKGVNESFRNFVNGSIIDCLLVFVITSLGLWLVGLKSPLLFGLFCGITNIIPYAGPYIGGIPAILVGFSQSPLTGILSLIVIAVIQGIEGNVIQPLIMSKTTKLHPVTIILGLLLFGYFWGIIGMIISTPLIAAVKSIIVYFDEKYDILNFN